MSSARAWRQGSPSEEQYRALSGVFDTLHEFLLDHCDNRWFMTLLESVRGIWVFARKTLTARITSEDLPLSFATSGQEADR